MKFIPVFLFALLAIQSTNGYPAPEPFIFGAVGDLVGKVGDAAGKIVQGGTGLAAGASDLVNGVVHGGLGLGSDIATGVIGGITGAVVQGAESLDKVTKAITDGIGSAITSATNGVVKRVATAFQKQVKQMQERAEKLLLAADEKTAQIREIVDEQVQAAKDSITGFSMAQQQKASEASEETQKKIQEKLDALASEANDKIDECVEGILTPIEDLNAEVSQTVQDSFPLIDAVILKIQECADLNQRDFKAITACANEVKEKAEELKILPGQYSRLLLQVGRVSSSSVMRSPCIISVNKELVTKKKALISEIEELLKNDKPTEEKTEETDAPAE